MRKIIILTIILSFAQLFYSCKRQASTTANEEKTKQDTVVKVKKLPPLEAGEVFYKNKNPFGETIELKGKHFEADTFIFKPSESKMIIKGNRLVMRNNGKPLYVFKYPDLTYIKTLGFIGNGPDEFMYPKIVETQDSANLCDIFEATNSKMYCINKNDEIEKYNSPFKKESSKQFGDWSHKENMVNIGKDDFVYTDYSKTGQSIFRTRREGDSVTTREIFSLQLNPKRKSPFMHIGDFAVNPQKNRMVYAYKYFKILKFMDMDAKTVKTVNFEREEFDENSLYKLDGLDKNITHYWGVCTQDEYVYFLYSGRTPYEVSREWQKQNYYIYVEQYDWNGNPVHKYKLDNWGYFTVDEKNKRIILLCMNFDDPFFVFEMP